MILSIFFQIFMCFMILCEVDINYVGKYSRLLFRFLQILGIERLLYVATTSGLIFISLDTAHHTPLPLPNAASEIRDTKVVHIDFDPIDKKLFMIDGDMGVIRRCNPDGTGMEVISLSNLLEFFKFTELI